MFGFAHTERCSGRYLNLRRRCLCRILSNCNSFKFYDLYGTRNFDYIHKCFFFIYKGFAKGDVTKFSYVMYVNFIMYKIKQNTIGIHSDTCTKAASSL